MTSRTIKSSVIFKNAFVLGDVDETFPAGKYDLETDEERLEGVSFLAYRRVATFIHLPPMPGQKGLSRTLMIDPKEVDAALARDVAATPAAQEQASFQKTSPDTAKTEQTKTDRAAEDRAQDEGMLVQVSASK